MPPEVYAFGLCRLSKKCARIYNAHEAIVPLVRFVKPFVLRRFRCRYGLYKVTAVVACKKSPCRPISVLLTSIIAIQTSKSMKSSKRTKLLLIVFHSGAFSQKILFHSPQEIFWKEFSPEFLVEWRARNAFPHPGM